MKSCSFLMKVEKVQSSSCPVQGIVMRDSSQVPELEIEIDRLIPALKNSLFSDPTKPVTSEDIRVESADFNSVLESGKDVIVQSAGVYHLKPGYYKIISNDDLLQ